MTAAAVVFAVLFAAGVAALFFSVAVAVGELRDSMTRTRAEVERLTDLVEESYPAALAIAAGVAKLQDQITAEFRKLGGPAGPGA